MNTRPTPFPPQPALRTRLGFSLIELLVAAALAAAVITAAVMIYQSLAASGALRSSYGTVTVGAALANFYGTATTTIDAYFAPNYGRAAQAEIVRDRFIGDLQRASAVFCLGRNGLNTIRPATISVSGSFRGDSQDTPEAFRQLLAAAIPASATIFTTYRGASAATNASIFILIPASDATTLSVLAVYDIDLTATTSPAGTYASVKRYEAGTLTDYYDVFYPASAGMIAFSPLVVCFERSGRRALVEGDSVDRLKQAAERPFYFVWWPDPSAHTLEAFSAPSYAASDPRSAYAAMGGRTPFFFAVPMFPAL
jgi:prepilin-type N-terminal cleavage/methylation domain-containing protein